MLGIEHAAEQRRASPRIGASQSLTVQFRFNFSGQQAQVFGGDAAVVQAGGDQRPGDSGRGKRAQVGGIAYPAAALLEHLEVPERMPRPSRQSLQKLPGQRPLQVKVAIRQRWDSATCDLWLQDLRP